MLSHRNLSKISPRLTPLLLIGLFAVTQTFAQTAPQVVSSLGYINGTALTAHTSAAFNSVGASTLVAFVSTNTPWNGLPVSISGMSDSVGNTWKLLTGPTTWSGSQVTLVSAIYYVNEPLTSASHTITVTLSNPAPLVFHVFAVSGADTTVPPISSAITDPGAGGVSANVSTAPISVAANSLLLSWVKNESSATATALGGFTLDTQQSTSYLWAESQTALAAGSYSGQFQYDSPIGWQTAIVGLQPLGSGPVAFSQAITTEFNTPTSITLTATSTSGQPLAYTVLTLPNHGTLSGTAPNLTYLPNSGFIGHDAFTFKVNDGTTDSNVATVSIAVRGPVNIVGTVGYLNGTPLTTHTSSPLNSVGASTLVAFVSSHPSWNGLPVTINGLSDNVGNTWKLLTGPTTWSGSQITLVSAIYYVNQPLTGASHTITVTLSNPAPLVFHVFAVSGADTTVPPISSAITDPGTGGVSANVSTAPISVATNSLLLSWVKNESGATATALGGFTLDTQQSTSYLWAESQTALSAGSYSGQFQYDSPIGWQTAIVGLQPPTVGGPPAPTLTSTPPSTTNQTDASFTFTDSQTGVSFLCQLDGSGFSSCTSPASYSSLSSGSHTFSVKAQDSAGNQSSATSFTWTIDTTAPPTPTITSTPANPTNQTGATFAFSDSEAGVSFLCQLDGSTFSACTSPTTYTSLTQGSHTFSVKARDAADNQSAPASFTWTINTTAPPVPTITSSPANPTNQTSASFSFSDSQPDVSFLCQLDGSAFNSCTSPKSYSTLSSASHIFSVKAQDSAGNQSSATSFTWTIDTTAPPTPTITSTPANPTSLTSASIAFTDSEAGVSFLCQLDGSTFGACSSPTSYSGLSEGSHIFSVKAQDMAGNQSNATSFTWTITPPAPTITSSPANPTNHTSATFSFTDSEAGVSFLCQLDGSAFGACSSPTGYSGLSDGSHTFSVEVQNLAGNKSSSTSFAWTIDTVPPPPPTITAVSPTTKTKATFSLTDSEAGVGFLCQLDASAFTACSSPVGYSNLSGGSHTFYAKAQDAAGNQSGATSFTWTIGTAPPKPTITSTPSNPTNQTSASFSFTDSQTGVSFLCQLDSTGFGTCSSPTTYSTLSQGSHIFSVKAQDSAGNQSSVASFTWTIDTTAPPAPTITSAPSNPTNQTGASFSFADSETGVIFLCQLDGSAFSACTSPKSYSSLTSASHTFSVKAQDSAGNQSSATSFTWTINTAAPPAPTITSAPSNPTNQTSASFSFADSETGVIFLCQLDGNGFSACSSPTTYPTLSQGSHTFSVKAQDGGGNQSSPTTFTWTIGAAPPPPTITSTPSNPTSQTSASFSFTDSQIGVSFLCQLDGSAFGACSSPTGYSGLSLGTHTFWVKAQDSAGNQSTATGFTWTIDVTAPPIPTITSAPANPTNQTNATFTFTDSGAGATLLCQLDGSAFVVCTSPIAYSGLTPGNHTFGVEARDLAGNLSAAASFTWVIDTTPPPPPTITSTNPMTKTKVTFHFSDSEAGVTFLCQLDGSGFSPCSSPASYSGLSSGSHMFSVKVRDLAGNLSAATSFGWTL